MKNIDGVRKIQQPLLKKPTFTPIKVAKVTAAVPVQQQTKTAPVYQKIEQQKQTKHIKLFSFFDYKQLATIATTFIITFVLSITTSQTLASHKNIFVPTNSSAESTANDPLNVTTTPVEVSLGLEVLDQPGQVYLPKENIELPNPLKKRQEFLEKYLKSKNSVLSEHVEALSEQSQWKLIIAISRAESSFCKRHLNNNCWGIGGAWNLKKYKNYDEAVADVNRILETYYINAGLNTPEKIVKKYVGHQSDNWEYAVQQELDNLKDVE